MTPVSSSRRRLTPLVLAVATVITLAGREVGWASQSLAAPSTHPASSVVENTPAAERARGAVFDGLRPGAEGSPCAKRYEMVLSSGEVLCTHGPDPAPQGVDVREPAPVPMVSGEAATALATSVTCQGDGTTGKRVQLVYARATGTTDRYASMLPSFQQWAARIDDMVNASAAEEGGSRRVRYVHDANCIPTVLKVTVTAAGDDNLANTIDELRAQGHNRTDRKYLVWMDANVYCGIAQVYTDDRPGQENYNNGPSNIPGMVARVDSGCWGTTNLVEAHELVHTLGSVQPGAPNATAQGHCSDEYDRMCYADAQGVNMRIVCSSTALENRLDCNGDDYFSVSPRAGSWLAAHWNTANSGFLAGGGSPPPPTTTTTKPPVTTTTTKPPATTTTTKPPATTTTTTKPPATTTTTKPPATTTTTKPPTPLPLTNQQFVQKSYADLLGRAPSAAETSFWLGHFANGLSRDTYATAMVTTPEFRRVLVNGYYHWILGRPADAAGLDAYVNAIANSGWKLEWVAMALFGSNEYYARVGGTPTAFVRSLYTSVLGMAPDTAGVNFWVDHLAKGLDRYTLSLAFLTTPLRLGGVVTHAYTWLIDKGPDAGLASFWVNQLTGGLRQEYLYAYLIGSADYLLRP